MCMLTPIQLQCIYIYIYTLLNIDLIIELSITTELLSSIDIFKLFVFKMQS